MTKLPHPSWQVKGVLSPAGAGQARAPYKVGPKCSICGKWADHSHHLGDARFSQAPTPGSNYRTEPSSAISPAFASTVIRK